LLQFREEGSKNDRFLRIDLIVFREISRVRTEDQYESQIAAQSLRTSKNCKTDEHNDSHEDKNEEGSNWWQH